MAQSKNLIPEFMEENPDDIFEFLFPLKLILDEDKFGNSHYEVVVKNITKKEIFLYQVSPELLFAYYPLGKQFKNGSLIQNRNNYIFEIEYKKANKNIESKYIRPHALFSNGYTFYVLVTYDEKNKINVKEERTLAINGIGKIQSVEYIKDIRFEQEYEGNAYGKYDNDKFIILNLTNKAANYFKREVLFNSSAFEVLNEEFGGDSITVKMYYNETIEIIKLVQQWLPEVTIVNDSIIREEVYITIKKNVKQLLENER